MTLEAGADDDDDLNASDDDDDDTDNVPCSSSIAAINFYDERGFEQT